MKIIYNTMTRHLSHVTHSIFTLRTLLSGGAGLYLQLGIFVNEYFQQGRTGESCHLVVVLARTALTFL